VSVGERPGGGVRDRERPPAPEPLAVPAIDAHCHLDLIDAPVEQTLADARAVGIDRVLTIGVDVTSSRWCADTAATYGGVHAGVAIHPNEAPRHADGAALTEIERLAALPQVRAVGETGLDYYRTGLEDRPAQERSFRAHVDIAKRAGKALMIHDRDAHDDVLRILDEEGAPDHVVFHCFSGDAGMARTCAERGYVMSFAGNVTFKNAAGLRAAAEAAPLDLLLVETDAPFLTPMPYRGRPNAPNLIPLTVRFMADLKGVGTDELCQAVTANAGRVFGAP